MRWLTQSACKLRGKVKLRTSYENFKSLKGNQTIRKIFSFFRILSLLSYGNFFCRLFILFRCKLIPLENFFLLSRESLAMCFNLEKYEGCCRWKERKKCSAEVLSWQQHRDLSSILHKNLSMKKVWCRKIDWGGRDQFP